MEYKSFGEYLMSLRKEKGLTAEEVGEKINVKIESVKRWERNLEIPKLDDIYKLSELYEVPCERLLRLKDELFKPNLKLIRKVSVALGISIKTLLAMWVLILIVGIIFAFSFLNSTNNNMNKKDNIVKVNEIEQM